MRTTDHKHRDALPSIIHLDLDKLKTERPEGRFPPINGVGASLAPMSSPSTAYSGPPPPYSFGAPSATSNQPGYISPPESTTRRSTRDEEKPSPARNSLPSIHEALGGERSLPPFSGGSQPGPGSAPSTAITAHFPEPPRGPSNPFSAPSFRENPFSSHPQPNPPPPPPPDLRSRDSASFQHPLSPRTSGSTAYHSGPLASSTFGSRGEHQPPQSPRQEPQRPAFSFPPASKPPAAAYNANGEPFHFPTPSTMSESRSSFARGPEPSYDHTIKRHIDVHEAARDLNDVCTTALKCCSSSNNLQIREISIRLYDTSQNWTHRYHQGNRSGFFQDSLPPLHELDELMRQSHALIENLAHVKEVVIQQQNALSEHRARFARPAEDDYAAMSDDYKSGGFAAGDAKKRRGVCPQYYLHVSMLILSRKPHRLADATAAIEPRHQNGEEVQTVREPSAMPAACTTPNSHAKSASARPQPSQALIYDPKV